MQFLRGGDKQAMLDVPKDVGELLNKAGDDFQKGLLKENPVTIWGISWEFKATGWSDVNGIHGYGSIPGPGSATTKELAEPIVAPKTPG
jgi:hypothetical protein